MWRQIALFGGLLAAGALALQWLDYLRLARAFPGEIAIGLMAAGFLALGLYLGARLFARAPAGDFDGNPKAVDSLGISPRELDVLSQLAAGRSNKEIAAALHVSPNTVKTHVGRLYAKLDAKRRTDAIAKARALGILP
jgi:DNA-binding CsgD family transcriptional regulator